MHETRRQAIQLFYGKHCSFCGRPWTEDERMTWQKIEWNGGAKLCCGDLPCRSACAKWEQDEREREPWQGHT